jgi:hypothetical protein
VVTHCRPHGQCAAPADGSGPAHTLLEPAKQARCCGGGCETEVPACSEGLLPGCLTYSKPLAVSISIRVAAECGSTVVAREHA